VAKSSSQKFIARNRAPRVQIEYDVELYGAEKKVQLPFVMGVLADLSGKPAEPLAPVADRKFLDIDIDNFDSRMKALKPRATFAVPNTLTGEGNINVELTFENMEDFSPAAVARILMRDDNWLTGNTTLYRRAPLIAAGGFSPELGSFCDGYVSRLLAARCGEKNVVGERASELWSAQFGNCRAGNLPRGIAGREDSSASLERRKEMTLYVCRRGERRRPRA